MIQDQPTCKKFIKGINWQGQLKLSKKKSKYGKQFAIIVLLKLEDEL